MSADSKHFSSSTFSRNFQVVKSKVMQENFDGLDALMETIIRFQAASGTKEGSKVRDLRPVSKEEASTIFSDYYQTKYGERGKAKKRFDYLRKKQDVLIPGEFDSYLYRPHGSGISGPEKYDMEGIDDDPSMHIGDGVVLPSCLKEKPSLKTKAASKKPTKAQPKRVRSKSGH